MFTGNHEQVPYILGHILCVFSLQTFNLKTCCGSKTLNEFIIKRFACMLGLNIRFYGRFVSGLEAYKKIKNECGCFGSCFKNKKVIVSA